MTDTFPDSRGLHDETILAPKWFGPFMEEGLCPRCGCHENSGSMCGQDLPLGQFCPLDHPNVIEFTQKDTDQ